MSNTNPNIILILIFNTLLVELGGCGGGGAGPQQTPEAIDTIAPALVNSTRTLVGEGGTDIITTNELSYRDLIQPASSVTFTVVQAPSNGQLEKISNAGIPISQFTQSDIDAGSIVYKHTRGNVSGDTIEFDVDDGQGNTLPRQTFNIDVIPNVSSLDLNFSGDTVQLSWLNPLLNEFTGVEIRRRDDGFYPDSPTEGALVYKSVLNEQQADDAISLSLSNDSQSRYYTIFSYGENEIFSDGVRTGLYCDSVDCVTVADVRELNNIYGNQDVESRRDTLINKIWGTSSLPDWMPDSITARVDSRYDQAQSIREIVVQMDYGLSSRIFYYTPFTPSNRLAIYHEGHRGIDNQEMAIIQQLLQDGFHVLQISMPITGFNRPVSPYNTHDDFSNADRPMRFFLEPIAVALNFATSERNFDGIYMMGISGGGWTTVLYSAIDTRISASYPVAGSYPFYLRAQVPGSFGDFEQVYPDFYQYVSYIELYVMASAGRRQLQVYNKYDDCCFSGTYSNTFKDNVQLAMGQVGGSFDILIDDTAVGHQITDFAFNVILSDMDIY